MSRRLIYTMPTWLAALKQISSQPAKVVFVGSSTTQGAVATSQARRYLERLGTSLRTYGGNPNDIHIHTAISADDGSYVKSEADITRTYNGLSGHNWLLAQGKTISVSLYCKSFSIIYGQGSASGSFTVTIDGGQAQTITPNTSFAADTHNGETLVDCGSYGLHSIVITATNAMRFCGIVSHIASATKGLFVYNGGIGGTASANFVNDTKLIQRLDSIGPHLVVLMIGSNDWSGAVNPATTYQTNIGQTVTNIKAGVSSNPDILLVQPYMRFDVFNQYTWAQYGTAQANVATNNPRCYYVDISGFYPESQTVDLTDIISSDNIHQTDAGHTFMAQLLYAVMR